MNKTKFILTLLLLGAAGVNNAWADRGHVHFGVTLGPLWGPMYYPPPSYYYPPYYPPYYPTVVERPAPQAYIERQIERQPAFVPTVPPAPPVAPAAAAPANYWYYCAAANSYYPYIKECSSGWQRVSPQPPDQP